MKPHLQIALALIWRGGEVLVARRAATAEHLPDISEFPGGKIEPGETPEIAAIREAREETGLEIEIVTAREIIEWQYQARRVSLHPFDCRITGGDISKCRFLAPQDLNADDFPAANRELIFSLQRQSPIPAES